MTVYLSINKIAFLSATSVLAALACPASSYAEARSSQITIAPITNYDLSHTDYSLAEGPTAQSDISCLSLPVTITAADRTCDLPSLAPTFHASVAATKAEEQTSALTLPAFAQATPFGPPNDQASSARPKIETYRYRTFGQQVGAVKWELGAIMAYYTAINGSKLFEDPRWPHTHSEGWFGKDTNNVGVDKLAHSYSSYILSEILHARLRRKTDGAPGIAFTSAALASVTMLYTELWDSIEASAGWSWEDVTFNTLGAGFSFLRNTIPGLDEKLDYRVMIVPNSDFITFSGKRHFEQQRHFLALKFAGFEGLNKGPARFLELHLGYYGKDFTLQDRRMGVEPKRRIFVGIGLNLRELFFKDSRSRVGRAAGDALNYIQPPYTVIQHHITN